MNIYSISIIARRDETLRIKPGIVLGLSEDDAHRRGIAAALGALPESDGWRDHQVILSEIPDDLALDAYRLTWRVEEA